jgi:hypothetical protein
VDASRPCARPAIMLKVPVKPKCIHASTSMALIRVP